MYNMSLEVFKQRILPMKDKLFRFAFSMIRDVQEAEDIVQDVMVRIWSRKEEWDQWQNMEAYCMTAARNACLDHLRKKGPPVVAEGVTREVMSTDKDPYEKVMNKETGIRIRKWMDALPEKQQMVVRLREVEGFSYSEIAEVLNLSLDQVKVNLFRARNAIKNSIIREESLWNNK
jgi:RNA polymerase sigma-70 factor, ECF subfamily